MAAAREEEVAGRRARRAVAQRILDELAVEFLQRSDVRRGPMFGSQGLLRNGKFFAFVGRAGDLVLKLPEAQATQLVSQREATAVKAGRNVTREWVSVPLPPSGGAQRWRELLGDAYAYAG
jgi:TfoX/Sxy family transcriptional regulator of competence genes